jgi:rod shape-determining protein MreD
MGINSISGQAILRPVSTTFITISLLFAFVINVLPLPRSLPVPDVLALVIVFWNIRQPRKVGIGLAWLFGLIMDVQRAGVLGETALAYTLVSYFAITLHRRVPWFSPWVQAAHMFPLFFGAHLVSLAVRLFMGGMAPPFWMLLSPAFTAALWPLANALLMAPQRRPMDPDENRPL